MLREDTLKIQHALAAYCRDGRMIDLPGSLPDRLPHYRRLVYNVCYGLMEKSFPVTKSLLPEADFKSMISAFLAGHSAQSPQVWKVPGEFYAFINNSELPLKSRWIFLDDLLKMEWTEILVYNRENRSIPNYIPELPSTKNAEVLNPDFEIIELKYPVFRGDWENLYKATGHYFLLIFRHTETLKVHFLEISSLHVRLIELMQKGITLDQCFQMMGEEYRSENISGLIGKLRPFISNLFDQGFILGCVKP